MKIKFKKSILIIAGILAVFFIGRVSKNQNAGIIKGEEIKKLRNLEIEEKGIKETEEVKESIDNGTGRGDALLARSKQSKGGRSLSLEKENTENQEQNLEQKSNQPNNENQNLFLVTRVIDGDTIELENGDKVRYIGVDTPESVDPRKPVQCFGKEASIKNEELVLGKRARLEKDVSEKDKYGRLLRYVYIGDIFINLKLVKQGYASAYTYPPDVKFSSLFVEAQKEAKEAGKGLWGKCKSDNGVSENSEITYSPVLSSEQLPLDPLLIKGEKISSECNIKGNISAKNEKIYHLPECGSYDKTVIDLSRGEKWFCSEKEAVNAGWRKAGNCE